MGWFKVWKLGRANVTNFELYLDFIKSNQVFQQMTLQLQEYEEETRDSYGSKIDFVI